ncbi:MAG: DUF2961 domain-containing protein [Candidatus Omnitrophica bacterium]|nr:DUF2961 domain-containing protein [Candidatus Omnitrophota bacterium]
MRNAAERLSILGVIFSLLATGFPVWAGLDNLIHPQDFRAQRSSSAAEDLGSNGDSREIPLGGTITIADLEGPGIINHIWTTVASYDPFYSRSMILRIYWDGADEPSVEVPIGDFFGVGHGAQANYSSLPTAVSSFGRARSCFWKMPFQKHAKVTVSSDGTDYGPAEIYYYVDWEKHDSLPENTPYFHARYRQEFPAVPGDYVILDTTGTGHYVGTVYSVHQVETGWFGEGDDRFYVDGEEYPSLSGTGTEDYFGDAWGFRQFATPYFGVSLWEGYQVGDRNTAYRWHIEDPVPFKKALKVSIEHRGSVFDEEGENLGQSGQRPDWVSSAALWYQNPPLPAHSTLPPPKERVAPYQVLFASQLGISATPEEAVKRDDPTPTIVFGPGPQGGSIDFSFEVEQAGSYQINAFLWYSISGGVYEAFLDGESLGEPMDFSASGYDPSWTCFDLHDLEPGTHILRFESRGTSHKKRDFAQPLDAMGMTYLILLRLEDMEGYHQVMEEKLKGK